MATATVAKHHRFKLNLLKQGHWCHISVYVWSDTTCS